MTNEDIIRMAREAELGEIDSQGDMWFSDGFWNEQVFVFAKLVAAAEREACAALCFQIWNKWMDEKDTTSFPDAEDCANAIRARGQQ
jgi:hypothetical protein